VDQIRATESVDLWLANAVLEAPDGTRRQIDASFIAGDCLYVLECKAVAVQSRIDVGDWAALQDRWKKLAIGEQSSGKKKPSYLEQAETLVEFLRSNPRGKSYPGGQPYQLPPTVSRIEPCLCTPFVEFVPDPSPRYWLDNETPRICVPLEVLGYATNSKPKLSMGNAQ